jgi:hypothetical protein
MLVQFTFGAEGFQIRDLRDNGRIVALEPFDLLAWSRSGDHVVH